MFISFILQPHTYISIGVLGLLLLFIINRQLYPYLENQFDSILITLSVLYAWILFFHGWRLDSILILAQLLLIILCVMTMAFNIIPMRFEIQNLKNYNQDIMIYIDKRNKEFYKIKCERDQLRNELNKLTDRNNTKFD